jgi:AraC-like DNA-binding protein
MEPSSQRNAENRDELVQILDKHCAVEGANEMKEGLSFFKHSAPTQRFHGLYSPSICIIAQGAKTVRMGEEQYRYDPANFLLCSLDVPVESQVIEASAVSPFLGLKMDLDPALITSVSVEAGVAPGRSDTSVLSIAVGKLDGDLLDAFVRLFRLLDSSSDYRVVSPLVLREIIYRLLISDQGPRLRQMAIFGGNAHRITKAVQTLRAKFNEPLSVEQLASDMGMSLSSFHQHFKNATSMSPLQFQKMLRLQEARRLLLSGDVDASSAAVRVGYDDASQFTREYKRLFGDPPMRDVNKFKQLSGIS